MGRRYEPSKTRKGKKNLKRQDGLTINQHGVKFTNEDIKKLEREVKRVNRLREKQIKEVGEKTRLVGGKETGSKLKNLQAMGVMQDTIITKQSKSLQRFHSKRDFERHLKHLEHTTEKNYVADRMKLYKANYMKALENEFGAEAKDIKMKVQMMKAETFKNLVEQDDFGNIEYIYDPEKRTAKMNKIREAINGQLRQEGHTKGFMKTKEIPHGESGR